MGIAAKERILRNSFRAFGCLAGEASFRNIETLAPEKKRLRNLLFISITEKFDELYEFIDLEKNESWSMKFSLLILGESLEIPVKLSTLTYEQLRHLFQDSKESFINYINKFSDHDFFMKIRELALKILIDADFLFDLI